MKFLKRINIFVILRLVIALTFIVSGAEKLLSPVENFIYSLQSYEIIPNPDIEEAIALIFPWIELFLGIFLLLGLWTKLAVIGLGAIASGFIFFVGQGIIRGLSLSDCGCFGDLVHFPIWVTFLIDWVILGIAIVLYIWVDKTKSLSLDHKLD